MKHPEHFCPFNDPPQTCDCYDKGYDRGCVDAIEEISKNIAKMIEDKNIGYDGDMERPTTEDEVMAMNFHTNADAFFHGCRQSLENLLKSSPLSEQKKEI